MATLHNAEDLARKDVREGDRVLIEKAGDVIPKVVKSIVVEGAPRSAPWTMPTACPVCGSALHRDAEEVVWRCDNAACPARLRRSLEHFTSRSAMNIEGLGESLIDQLLEQDLVHDFADIYALDAAQLENLVVTPREPRSETGAAAQAREGRPQRHRADRTEQVERPLAADLRARHPPRRREGRRDAGAAFPDDGSRARRVGRSAADGAGDRPGRRRSRCGMFSDEPRNRRIRRAAGRRRREHGQPGARAWRRARSAGGEGLRASRGRFHR